MGDLIVKTGFNIFQTRNLSTKIKIWISGQQVKSSLFSCLKIVKSSFNDKIPLLTQDFTIMLNVYGLRPPTFNNYSKILSKQGDLILLNMDCSGVEAVNFWCDSASSLELKSPSASASASWFCITLVLKIENFQNNKVLVNMPFFGYCWEFIPFLVVPNLY